MISLPLQEVKEAVPSTSQDGYGKENKVLPIFDERDNEVETDQARDSEPAEDRVSDQFPITKLPG